MAKTQRPLAERGAEGPASSREADPSEARLAAPTGPESLPGAKGLVGLAVVAMLFVVLAGLRAASDLVAQTLLGLVLAVGALPILGGVRRLGLPTTVGAGLASLALLVLASSFGVLIGFAGSQLAKELPRFRASFESAQESLKQTLIEYDAKPLIGVVDQAVDFSKMDVLPRLLDAATSVGSIGFVLFVALFTLFEVPTFEDKWRRVTSSGNMLHISASRVLADVQRYLLVKTGTCVATGLLVGLWTWALGLEAAVLWGFLAFALNYIPILGSLLATIPPTLVGFIAFDGFDLLRGMGVLSGILIVNFTIGNIIEPRVMGRTMGLSPLIVLLSVALWGWVLGPVGALLSVPLTVIVKLSLERSERYSWVAVLLDSPVRFRAD